jgi:hypothetical protein
MAKKRRAASAVRQLTSYAAVLTAVGAIAIGAGLMYLTHVGEDFWKQHPDEQAVLREIGALVLATVAISILWELVGHRKFMDEVLERTGVAKELTHAGIRKIVPRFQDLHGDWEFVFEHSRYINIFFAYAQSWRHTHGELVAEYAKRDGNHIRVVLPDPDDAETLAELTRRFAEHEQAEYARMIRESAQFFLSLRPAPPADGANVEVRFVPKVPLFSFYVFDRGAIIAFYSHRGRVSVPSFLVDRGSLYDFARSDFERLFEHGRDAAGTTLGENP